MIRISICLIFVLCQLFLFSQKEDYNWVLFNNLRVNFNLSPPAITSDISNLVGNLPNLTSISDKTGNLLFYINGNSLYNYNHQLIFKTTAAVLNNQVNVIPHPSDEKKYFWFMPIIGTEITKKLIIYTIDMNANSGLGSVTETYAFVGGEMTTNFVIIRRSNLTGYWFVRFFNDKIAVSPLTSAGFGNPTIYNIAFNEDIHDCKVTPDMSKIFTKSASNHIYFFDFNIQTGELNSLHKLFTTNGVYEFSRNYEFIYLAIQNSATYETTISQFSMNLIYNEAEFLNSEKILFHQTLNFNFRLRDMQLAPNNKIYITFNDYYLWSIDNPDLPVPFCSVNNQSLWLNGVKSGVYLPNYFSYYINFSFRQLCSHVDFSYIGVAGSHCFWNFGDGQTSTAINPTHAYTNAGTYTVTLEVTLSDNTSQTITKTIEIFNKPTNVLIEHD